MDILNGIQNTLQFISNSWSNIIIIIGLCITIKKKAEGYFKKSDEEKIAIAKKQIQESALKLVTDAEEDYSEWKKAGLIKRSQVIEEIFLTYPILSKVANQEELIAWIDSIIDEALEVMRDVIEKQVVDEIK